ncbi:MAG: hypothetical protein BWZ05_02051 [Bacteroidetes bacterium ADurb.BinA245]|nr:MAG: hypothetical protein BWZ05_02051 [Bacteroidetes bacterium ADurb.BinA245]
MMYGPISPRLILLNAICRLFLPASAAGMVLMTTFCIPDFSSPSLRMSRPLAGLPSLNVILPSWSMVHCFPFTVNADGSKSILTESLPVSTHAFIFAFSNACVAPVCKEMCEESLPELILKVTKGKFRLSLSLKFLASPFKASRLFSPLASSFTSSKLYFPQLN